MLVNRPFHEIVEFSRASTATGTGPTGRIYTAAIDEPRFVYDPATGSAQGLLVEGQATNLFSWSEDFDRDYWVKLNSLVQPNAGLAPDGSLTATRIIANSETGQHSMYRFITPEEGTATFSAFVKAGEYTKARLTSYQSSVPSNPAVVHVDLATGDVLFAGGTTLNFGVERFPGGWWRIFAAGPVVNTSASWTIGLLDDSGNTSFEGDGVSGIYIWGAQLEEGTRPTSYIPTEGSQVTRAGDHNMVSIPSQNSNRGGSLCIDLTSFVFGNYSAALFANNPFEGFLWLCATHISPEGIEYGISLAALTGITFFPLSGLEENKRHKLSVGWSGRSFVAFLDGVKVADEIDVGFDIPSFNELNLFSNSDVGLTSGAAGLVNKVAYYSNRLPDAQLAALTEL